MPRNRRSARRSRFGDKSSDGSSGSAAITAEAARVGFRPVPPDPGFVAFAAAQDTQSHRNTSWTPKTAWLRSRCSRTRWRSRFRHRRARCRQSPDAYSAHMGTLPRFGWGDTSPWPRVWRSRCGATSRMERFRWVLSRSQPLLELPRAAPHVLQIDCTMVATVRPNDPPMGFPPRSVMIASRVQIGS
jgi:hypothetical protein